MRMSLQQVEKLLALVMEEHPDLNDFGIGLYLRGRGLSAEQRHAQLMQDREQLRASAPAVLRTVIFLRENIVPRRTVNTRRSSYGIKHLIERELGYVTNGVMIAAGIIAGYPYRVEAPNVLFGMSEKSLRLRSERRKSSAESPMVPGTEKAQ